MLDLKRINNCMLWAAYGDALGFITEMCNKETLKYRTNGTDYISRLVKWKRKIGGKYGISVNLPCGCYSDDTQLRLAVCRSINNKGKFDFETFSKIELPVFLAYGLGVGRGTRAAGESLLKRSVQWNTNFYNTKYSKYINGGGNGAAMRIQPHVLTSPQGSHELISQIMRDTIITHGHPIGWVGAVFHGLTLQHCLVKRECPSPSRWESIANETKRISKVCSEDPLLSEIWLPTWEREAGKTVEEGVDGAVSDLLSDISKLLQVLGRNQEGKYKNSNEAKSLYHAVVKAIDGLEPSVRGSGNKTALLSTFIGHYFSEHPAEGIELCVNTLGSDTDTIATMAGALLGAFVDNAPPQEVLDQDYIEIVSRRLLEIGQRKQVKSFGYPDLLQWGLPKSQVDYTGIVKDQLALSGLGIVYPFGEATRQKKGTLNSILQFVRTDYGQTLLLKYRDKPKELGAHLLPLRGSTLDRNEKGSLNKDLNKNRMNVWHPTNLPNKQTSLPFGPNTIEDITNLLIKEGFNERDVGRQLLRFAESNNGIEKAIAFAAIIVKAKRARLMKK